jgi:hypothetical protein
MPHQTSAQATGRSIAGKITSSTGAPVPKAKLTIKNLVTGESISIIGNDNGTFIVSNLSPAKYEITAVAPGFTAARATVTMTANADQVAGVTLYPTKGEASSMAVSGVINSKSVSELPLNGRSPSDLAALEPGVATARTQASGQGQYGYGTQMTISGGRPRQNDALLDKISVNDYANGPPGSALGVNLGADAVEQFSVLTSNYPALFGRSSGGIIGASTRSGTNHFHGSAFEYLRNSAFDARNFFDTKKPPFRRNQFGGSAGGPLRKDHTYFFAAYEGLRQSLGITQVDTVPSAAAREGNLSTGQVKVDPAVLRFINAFYPLPNGPLLKRGDTGIFSFSGQEITPENYFTTKIDHSFSITDTLAATYMFDTGTVTQPDELNNKLTGYNSRRQFLAVHENHSSTPTLLNSFRFGIYRVVANTGLTFASGNALAGDPSFGTVPGQTAAATFVSGLTTFSGGLNGLTSYHFNWTSIQAYDDMALNKGQHSFKFGFGMERIRDNIRAASRPSGEFSFDTLTDFLSNQPFSVGAKVSTADSARGFRQTIFAAYLQDDWRLLSNLSVNLGLRYEMATELKEVHGSLTVLRNLTDPAPHLGDPLVYNPTLRNFEPRVGFTWDPFKNGKSSVNGGFGMFDVLPLPYLFHTNELFSAPFFEFGSATRCSSGQPPPCLSAGSFPRGAYDMVAASTNTFRQGYFDPHPRRNYVMQWNLTFQREIARDLDVRLGYVGSRGIHQPFRVEDADMVLPTLTAQGYLWPAPIGSGTRLNEGAGRITAAFWEGQSYYNALQFRVKKKLSRGSQIQGSYTWGKSIDTSSGSVVGDEYLNSISSPLWFNTRINRGPSDFNIAHNLEINYTWDLGTRKWRSGILKNSLGGWQLGGVFEASTGVPFTVGFAGDALGLKTIDPSIDVPNLVGGASCASLTNPGNPTSYIATQCFAVPTATPSIAANCVNVTNIDPVTHIPVPEPNTCLNLRGNLGRNTLIGPGLVNLDFSVFKNNYIKRISDSFNVQFRAEFFNILNHTNFSPPLDNRNVFDSKGHPIANAGLITSTQTTSRQIQFALKLIW